MEPRESISLDDFIPKEFRNEIEKEFKAAEPAEHERWLRRRQQSKQIWNDSIRVLQQHYENDRRTAVWAILEKIWFQRAKLSVEVCAARNKYARQDPGKEKELVRLEHSFGLRKVVVGGLGRNSGIERLNIF